MKFAPLRLDKRDHSFYRYLLGNRTLLFCRVAKRLVKDGLNLSTTHIHTASVTPAPLPAGSHNRNKPISEDISMSNIGVLFKLIFKRGVRFLLFLPIMTASLFFMMPNVYAVNNCIMLGNSSYVATLPGSTINVGQDLPIGSVIYNFTTSISVTSGVTCTTDSPPQTITVSVNVDYLLNPLPLSGYSGGGLAGKVYETGLPGVGVVITGICRPVNRCLIPRADNTFSPFNMTDRDTHYSNRIGRGWIVWFIKTGNIAPGTISGSQLPSLKTYIAPSPSYIAEVGNLNTVSFAGNINFVSGTCATPDVNVSLGSYDVGAFGTVGATTPWVDSSIKLTNCAPAFSGYYDLNNSTVSLIGAGTLPAGTRNNNLLNVALTPQNPIIDATNGIMAVSSTTAAPAAGGVGIQMAWGNASGSPTFFNLNGTQNFTPPSDGRQSITIPLAARYIRTGPSVTPGRADGKVTFTINYY